MGGVKYQWDILSINNHSIRGLEFPFDGIKHVLASLTTTLLSASLPLESKWTPIYQSPASELLYCVYDSILPLFVLLGFQLLDDCMGTSET